VHPDDKITALGFAAVTETRTLIPSFLVAVVLEERYALRGQHVNGEFENLLP